MAPLDSFGRRGSDGGNCIAELRWMPYAWGCEATLYNNESITFGALYHSQETMKAYESRL